MIKIYSLSELLDIVQAFCEAGSELTGKAAIWRLLLLVQIANSVLFSTPDSRAILCPSLIRWLKPYLVKLDTHAGDSTSESASDAARILWLECVRLSTSVTAVMLDRFHTALVDPAITTNRQLLAQEQDNIEYLLSLMPRFLAAYRQIEHPQILATLTQSRTPASIISNRPVLFPASYPFALLTARPQKLDGNTTDGTSSLSGLLCEVAAVLTTMLHLAPPNILGNFLDASLEVEGRENFTTFLTNLFHVGHSMLLNEAMPSDWLNANLLLHCVLLKLVEPLSAILEREFIPTQEVSYTFNFLLWRDFFAMFIRLLASMCFKQ